MTIVVFIILISKYYHINKDSSFNVINTWKLSDLIHLNHLRKHLMHVNKCVLSDKNEKYFNYEQYHLGKKMSN